MALAGYVTVRNLHDDRELKGSYNSEPWVIPAGKSAVLPREAAIIAFGDWESRPGIRVRNPDTGLYEHNAREVEFARIRGRCGVAEGAVLELDGKEVPSEALLEDRLPKVQIEEMDGTKVVTVVEDPKGEGLPVEGSSMLSTQELLARLEEQQKRHAEEIERLKQQAFNVATSNTEMPDEDKPSTRRKPSKPRVDGAQVAEVSSLDD